MGEGVAYNPTDSGVVHSHPFFIVMQSRIVSPVPSSSRTEIRHFNVICKTVILKHQYIDQGKITHIAKVFFYKRSHRKVPPMASLPHNLSAGFVL